MSPAVAFERVAFVHPSGERALDDVDFALEPRRTLAIVGRSGAGKSTLLRLTNALLMPTRGRVLVEGRATSDWDVTRLRRHIGYVLQDVGLFPHLTVAENLALLPNLEKWPANRIAERVDALLRLVELPPDEFAGRLPAELSGGQRQRAGVARALVLDPPILLMDEPFGALDAVTRQQLHAVFGRVQSQLHRTVMIVTHDLREALLLGQDLAVVDGGRLVAYGPASEVVRDRHEAVRALVDTLQTPVAWTAP